MRIFPTLIIALLAAGCATSERYDARLNGTWRSNRELSVAAAFQRDPRWTNAPAEKVERFKAIFGHMTISYRKNDIRCEDRDKEWSLRYRIVERGEDFVVIRTEGGGIADKQVMRIRFVDNGAGYWIDSGKFLGMDTPEEKFDRVTAAHGAPTGIQPFQTETNRTSAAADYRR